MAVLVRLGTLLALLVVSISCNNAERPTAPSSLSSAPPTIVQSPPIGGGPPVSGLAGVYVVSGPLSYPIKNYTTMSRYVLRDGGAFSLEYPSLRLEYGGTYTNENGRVMFRFAADDRWGAVGTFNGELLEVRYSEIAEHSDFEDAAYRRSQ
jgi:hypothetical protein